MAYSFKYSLLLSVCMSVVRSDDVFALKKREQLNANANICNMTFFLFLVMT